MLFLTMSGVEHRYPVIYAELVYDDQLHGGAGVRPSLEPGDAECRAVAGGKPLGYYCKLY